MKELRRYPRYSISGTIIAAFRKIIQRGSQEGDAIRASVMDLSRNGAGMRVVVLTSQPYRVDDTIHIEIELSDGSAIDSMAEVKWTKPLPENVGYYLGVEFSEISDKDKNRLNQFLAELGKEAPYDC